jgi:hypothetical protein
VHCSAAQRACASAADRSCHGQAGHGLLGGIQRMRADNGACGDWPAATVFPVLFILVLHLLLSFQNSIHRTHTALIHTSLFGCRGPPVEAAAAPRSSWPS